MSVEVQLKRLNNVLKEVDELLSFFTGMQADRQESNELSDAVLQGLVDRLDGAKSGLQGVQAPAT